MMYTTQIGEYPGTIVARFSGEHEPGTGLSACKAVLELAKANGLKRVLLDLTEYVCAVRSSINDYGFALLLCDNSLRGTRVAIVQTDSSGLDVEFVELVAGNRGLATKGFLDEDAAVAWLCESTATSSPVRT